MENQVISEINSGIGRFCNFVVMNPRLWRLAREVGGSTKMRMVIKIFVQSKFKTMVDGYLVGYI